MQLLKIFPSVQEFLNKLCKMPIVENARSFEELKDGLETKIKALEVGADIRCGMHTDTPQEVEWYWKECNEISSEIKQYRYALCSFQSKITSLKQSVAQLKNLSERIMSISKDAPKLIPQKPVTNGIIKKQGCEVKKSASKKVRRVSYCTQKELDSVPKYARGRLTLQQINKTIDDINKTLEGKYKLMAKPKNKMTPMELNSLMVHKMQENHETKGEFFVVDNDFKEYTKLSLNSSTRNILTVLRTIKKLKEIRGPKGLVRYCVA